MRYVFGIHACYVRASSPSHPLAVRLPPGPTLWQQQRVTEAQWRLSATLCGTTALRLAGPNETHSHTVSPPPDRPPGHLWEHTSYFQGYRIPLTPRFLDAICHMRNYSVRSLGLSSTIRMWCIVLYISTPRAPQHGYFRVLRL